MACSDVEHLATKIVSMRLMLNGVPLAVDQIQGLHLQLYTSANVPPTQSWDLSKAGESGSLHFSKQPAFQIIVSCKSQGYASPPTHYSLGGASAQACDGLDGTYSRRGIATK